VIKARSVFTCGTYFHLCSCEIVKTDNVNLCWCYS